MTLCEDCIHAMIEREYESFVEDMTCTAYYCGKTMMWLNYPDEIKTCKYRQTENRRDMRDWDTPGVGMITLEGGTG